ncbi:MAG: SPASM domain-containing protein [Gammaproteobacteria bacterium]|nr:SPASM domain-containing protein [Gammaproteobacteria bacterium]
MTTDANRIIMDLQVTAPEDFARRAQGLLERGQAEDAHRLCCEALDQFPDELDLLMLRAHIEASQGKFIGALATLDQFLQRKPGDPLALSNRNKVEALQRSSREHPYTVRYLQHRSVHMDYPRTVSIETTGRCNATCNFCPAPELERKHLAMPEALFRKIIEDLKAIPEHVPLNINTNVVNEPFMDKRMFARLQYINEQLPRARIQIYSNFNVLPRNYMASFRKLRNFMSLNVSFNAANKHDYESVMHIDFDRTVEHLRTFMTGNRSDRFLRPPVILSRVADNTNADKAYIEDCRKLFAEFEEGVDYLPKIKPRITWLGDTHIKQGQIPYFLPCDAWLDMNIMCTGVVPLCCIDAHGDHAVGDVSKHSVLDVYNSPGFRKLREKHLQREGLNPCGGCSPYAEVREDPNHFAFRTVND